MDHAVSSKKLAHFTWFDCEDAFGSLNHVLIPYVFLDQYYNIPYKMVTSLYRKLQGTVKQKEWKSETFVFQCNEVHFTAIHFIEQFVCDFLSIYSIHKETLSTAGLWNKTKKYECEECNINNICRWFKYHVEKNKVSHQKLVLDVETKVRSMGLHLSAVHFQYNPINPRNGWLEFNKWCWQKKRWLALY